jgi:hypothetical protein
VIAKAQSGLRSAPHFIEFVANLCSSIEIENGQKYA